MNGRRAREQRRHARRCPPTRPPVRLDGQVGSLVGSMGGSMVGPNATPRQRVAEAQFITWTQAAIQHLMAVGATPHEAVNDLAGTMDFILATYGREQLFRIVDAMAGLDEVTA